MGTRTICPHCHAPIATHIYEDERLYIDSEGYVVRIYGARISLTATEYRLLACLVANAPRILTHRQILISVWGWEYQDDVDYVRLYVWKLRHKLEVDTQNPQYIISENGLGYYFNSEGEVR